ncbi:MAG TPA: hypothetical protein VNA44_00055 [Burkholderiaceae bacterium]|nr:hypothetical protein [Burkholderiaceae bacterium]
MARLIGGLLLGAGASCILGLAIAPWVSAPDRALLVATSITSARGAAYFVHLPRDKGKVLRPSGDVGGLFPTPMQLLEDGKPIGRPAHSFDEVVEKGDGRFAYVHPALAFATSDGSDPRTNGRTYQLERPIKPRRASWLAAGLAVLIGLGLAFPNGTRTAAIVLLRVGPESTASTKAGSGRWLAGARHVAFALATLTAIGLLLSMWWGSSSAHLGVAGFLPVSDALGYYGCALSISASHDTYAAGGISDWCARRMLYPSMLNSLLGLTGWRPSAALALQALTIGLSSGAFLLALQKTFGWITALLATTAVLAFAREFAIGNFMTEALALPAGLMGLALLLSAQKPEINRNVVLLGLALISLGMAIRPGALLSLPLLGIWLLLVTRPMLVRPRVAFLLAGAIALVLGPALHYATMLSLGVDPNNSGGNYAASLSGLSTGSRDWSQAYRDYADVFRMQPETVAFQIVQRAALLNISADPYTFIGALMAAGKAFSVALFAFSPLPPYNTLATWLFCFGLLLCAFHFRRPAAVLLLALCFGELISAPFVYDSGYQRVFTVTVAARIAVMAYAVAWIAGLLAGEKKRGGSSASDGGVALPTSSPTSYAAMIGVGLFALAILPATPLARLWRLTPLPASGDACTGDQWEVVAQPGRESMRMTFGDRSLPLGDEQLGSLAGHLEFDPEFKRAWWSSELPPQPRGAELVYAVQRTSPSLGRVVAAFSSTPLPIWDDRPLSFCLAREPSADVKLGDLNAHEILRVIDRSK